MPTLLKRFNIASINADIQIVKGFRLKIACLFLL